MNVAGVVDEWNVDECSVCQLHMWSRNRGGGKRSELMDVLKWKEDTHQHAHDGEKCIIFPNDLVFLS